MRKRRSDGAVTRSRSNIGTTHRHGPRAKTYAPDKGQKRKTDVVVLEQGMRTEHGHGLKG